MLKLNYRLLGALLIFLMATAVMASAKKQYKTGNKFYKNKKYEASIPYFLKAVLISPQKYEAKGNYKVALAFSKLDQCDKAYPYFEKAITADPIKGGASTPAKLVEKLTECNLALADFIPEAGSSDPVPETDGSSSGGKSFYFKLLIGIAVFVILVFILRRFARRTTQRGYEMHERARDGRRRTETETVREDTRDYDDDSVSDGFVAGATAYDPSDETPSDTWSSDDS